MVKLKEPDFIVVGAMKSGTTSLMDYLCAHTEIGIPKKELHFFNRNENFEKGRGFYLDELNKCFKEENIILGEKTPTYSFQENCASRIYELFPNVKIIWVFRNPVDRAFSNYMHAANAGVEGLPFKSAIEREKKRLEKNIWKGYRLRGEYVSQVRNFLKFFPLEQMHFVLFEELINIKSQKNTLLQVCDFLSVSYQEISLPKSNKSPQPIFPFLLYYFKKLGLEKRSVFAKMYKKFNLSREKDSKNSMDKETREKLIAHYMPYNKSLSELIGKDLSIWSC